MRFPENSHCLFTLSHVPTSPPSDTKTVLRRLADPAFLVTRSLEDFVTWVDTSKIKRKVQKYNDKLDDYELLG